LMYLLNETFAGNGEDHEGAVFVSPTGAEQDARWLPELSPNLGDGKGQAAAA